LTEAELAHTESDLRLQLQLRRRVKRGVVASYIRELSQRRNGSAPHDEAPAPSVSDVGEDA
jgi:hypothetical protein